jgi:uncharacterized membrane protein
MIFQVTTPSAKRLVGAAGNVFECAQSSRRKVMNWYYQHNDAAQGPVSEETFRALITNGTIRPDTLVWHEGMAEWQPLSVADPDLAGTAPAPGSPDAPATFAELKNVARTGPAGNYWTYAGAAVVWILVLAFLKNVSPLARLFFPVSEPDLVDRGIRIWSTTTTMAFAILMFGSGLLHILATCLQRYGMANLGLAGAYRKKLAFDQAFIGFNQFGRAFGCMFLTGLFTFLWSLLLVIPGIVKAFSYMLTPYIVLEHPELSVTEAITESRRLMDGNKWRAFFLGLSFLGWWILGILTCGILFLWIAPYQGITFGAFYRAVLREKGPRPAAVP